MKTKFLLGVVLSLMLSSNAMAQSGSSGQAPGQGSQMSPRGVNGAQPPQRGRARPSRPVAQSVPELDGSMAFLALGLTFAVGALIREKRRPQ